MIDRIGGLEHLIILGAGATCAAFPDGDASGRAIPAMNKFMEKTGLIEKFSDVREEINAEPNLEDLFSKWSENPSRKTHRENLEKEIRGYLTNLESTGMNLYVKLLLSLTDRDVIATFNWDPLLAQIYRKLSCEITEDLPHLLFLHGNVAMGYCPHCRRTGYLHDKCGGCDNDFAEMSLLYPVKNKNYNENIYYIRSAWEDLGKALAKASVITFFGYSAPVSDTAAQNMMNEAFRQDPLRNIVEFQLINTADETELRNSYGDFNIKPNHMSIVSSFYDSYIARYPRRSADNLYNTVMFCRPSCYPEKLSVTKEDGILELILKINSIERNSLNENGFRRLETAKSHSRQIFLTE